VDIGVKDGNGWRHFDFTRFYGDLNAVDILEGGCKCDVEVLEQAPLRLEPERSHHLLRNDAQSNL